MFSKNLGFLFFFRFSIFGRKIFNVWLLYYLLFSQVIHSASVPCQIIRLVNLENKFKWILGIVKNGSAIKRSSSCLIVVQMFM